MIHHSVLYKLDYHEGRENRWVEFNMVSSFIEELTRSAVIERFRDLRHCINEVEKSSNQSFS